MIGLSLGGKSRAGVVHNPFSEEDSTKGRTIFGTIEHGIFKIQHDEKSTHEENLKRKIEYIKPFDHLEQPSEDHKFTVAASISHFSAQMKTSIALNCNNLDYSH